MNKYKWIFFDLDGTLMDSLTILYDVYVEFLNKFDKYGTKYEFEQLNGPSIKEIVEYLQFTYSLPFTSAELLKHYNLLLEKNYLKNVSPIAERIQLLECLKLKKFKLALVTSLSQKLTFEILKKFDLNKYFSIVVCGDEVQSSKPHPQIYQLCLSRTNTIPDSVLVIEDSKNGSESASKAGLDFFLVNNSLESKNILLACENEF